jgi:hypothetical protein
VQQRLLFPASPLRSWRQADYLIRRQVLPRWAKLRAADITRSDAKTLVAGIMAPTVANQTLAACSAIYAWAIKEESGGMSCQHREQAAVARNDHINRVGRADVIARLNVARRLREPVEPVKLFPRVFLSEAAAHAAGLVRAARDSQRLTVSGPREAGGHVKRCGDGFA